MEIRVSSDQAGTRLDQLLKTCLPEVSRASIQKAIRQGSCRVDDKIEKNPSYRVRSEQQVCIFLPENDLTLEAERGDVVVIWQDEWLAVCDKAAGISVHPCPSCRESTLCNRLLYLFPQLASQGGERPGIVHRLDKDTTGLLLVALEEKSRLKLATEFARRKVQKEYLALVYGKPPENGECREPIGRHQTMKTRMAVVPENRGGKSAHTLWRRLWHDPQGNFSLLAVRILTGRTHQIRVHMSALGFPLLGDRVYAPAFCAEMAPRQMLHAWKLELTHPETGQPLHFCASLPQDFMDTVITNATHAPLVVITGNQGCGKTTFSNLLAKRGLPLISADAIVAELYKNAGTVARWVREKIGAGCLASDGAVNKAALFEAMQKEPGLRKELEELVHALVFEKIKSFYIKHEKDGMPAVLAEIPLYFESGGPSNFQTRPFVIGINCGQERRWQRIAKNRNWSQEKISSIEAWQWPEARKMAASDFVVNNIDDEAALDREADRTFVMLFEMAEKSRQQLKEKICNLCACESAKMQLQRDSGIFRKVLCEDFIRKAGREYPLHHLRPFPSFIWQSRVFTPLFMRSCFAASRTGMICQRPGAGTRPVMQRGLRRK